MKWMSNLGAQLGERYSYTREMADLDHAIRISREAPSLAKPDRAMSLNNLALRLREKYLANFSITDLDEAISTSRKAVEMTPQDHPDRAKWMANLGSHLNNRFTHTGDLGDLDEAISLMQEAMKSTSVDGPTRLGLLNNMGLRLASRYYRTGRKEDLEEAIRLVREALDATPVGHPDRCNSLGNLGLRLGDQWHSTGDVKHLEEAICKTQEALDALPPNHPQNAMFLNNLAIRYGDRYDLGEVMEDLDQAILMQQGALGSGALDHSERARCLTNLGRRLNSRYSRMGVMEDLEEAISLTREALDQSPPQHQERSKRVIYLGIYLGDRYSRTGEVENLEEAIRMSQEGIQATPENHLERPAWLHNLAVRLSDRYYCTGSLADLEEAIRIAEETALYSSACSISIRVSAGRHFLLTHDILADSRAYDVAKTTTDLIPLLTPRSLKENTDRRYLLAQAVGISSDAAAIALHANQGPLAAINCLEMGRAVIAGTILQDHELAMLKKSRPDLVASFIDLRNQLDTSHGAGGELAERSGIRLLELPHLTAAVIDEYAQKPGLAGPLSSDQLPHVWWVPTGKLTRLPLHAAGYHKEDDETAMHMHRGPAGSKSLRLVAVAMEETVGHSPLPHARSEIEKVTAALGLTPSPENQPRRCKESILSAIQSCQIFHFASHGETNAMEPLQSQMLLQDWREHPLTVQSLLKANLNGHAPFLAYLSACGTGQIRNEESMDESIHLANACQLAGFRHVIDTLWTVEDEICVRMASLIYKFLQDQGFRDESVSRAIHCATMELRIKWLSDLCGVDGTRQDTKGGRDAQLDGNSELQPLWVPYVHFGL
ncbi:CHAT domain-containing protein [Trichoderma austrokoningii]